VPAWSGEPAVMEDAPGPDGPPEAVMREGIRVIPQRQSGLVAVPLHLTLGFLSASDLAKIGTLAETFSQEKGLRATRSQNMIIRHVPEDRLSGLVGGLRGLETDVLSPAPLQRFVACAGASTCRLGLCLARGAAKACADALARSGLSRKTLDALDIHINGCANSCGQQPVGPIGLFGVALRSGDRLVPAYAVSIGGYCGANGAKIGKVVGKVPVRALPDLLAVIGLDFEKNRVGSESFTAYAERRGLAHFEGLVAAHAAIPSYEERPDFYRDAGADEDFSLAGRGAGECGAGVFEVIRQDLEAAKQGDGLFGSLLPAARALLITRGVDAREPDAVFREFEGHFIGAGLVSDEFRALLDRAREFVGGRQAALDGQEQAVVRLREGVELLFSTLDANLEFHPPEAAGGKKCGAESTRTAELNLRGVPCPLNFVKAKLRLETLAIGDTLSLILDDGDPVRNVPVSLKGEGQQVVETTDLKNGHWRVTIRKNV
jgi:sulfite reductase (ferredoxin)